MEFFRGPLPLEKICRFLLNEKFAKVLKQKVTKDQLTLDLPSGKLTVSDIDLNPSIFNTGKSVLVRAVKIGNVEVQMAGKAAKSFFSDTVHDNLTVKVSGIFVELDIMTDDDAAAKPRSSDEEVHPGTKPLVFPHLMQFDDQGIVAAVLAAIGVSSSSPASVGDSWNELEAQMPSDSDGREQLSHIIKQFLLLAEFEASGVSIVCNVFRSGRRYHPSQFRFTVDTARFLNDFSHLKGKSMPSSSVEHLTHIIFGRQLRIGKISIDARDGLADHCAAAAFEDQRWVPIFSSNLSPSSNLGSESNPFCQLQFQLRGFESDLDIVVRKIDICVDDMQFMLDHVHMQLFLSCAKMLLNGGSSNDAFASRHKMDASDSERAKGAKRWFEQPGSIEDALSVSVKSVSFLVACIDQPLRKKMRRQSDSDWLCSLQGVRFIAGPIAILATSDLVSFQELFSDGRRNEIIRIQCRKVAPHEHQQFGVSVKVACDSSSTHFSMADVCVELDFELLHRLNAAFYWHTKSLQALFSKSHSSPSSLNLMAASIELKVRLPQDILHHYHAQHSSGFIMASIRHLSLQLHADQSFDVTFDEAQLDLAPDSVIARHLGSVPNTIRYRKESQEHDATSFCMACGVALGNVDVRLSTQMRPLIFALGTEFAARLPHPPMDPPPLGTNFKCIDAGESDRRMSRSDSQSSDDDQFGGSPCSPMGHESMLRSSMYVSAHSSFPLQESASVMQTSEPSLLPLYFVLMRNALHAMGASFSGQDSFAHEIPNSLQNLAQDIPLPPNYRFSIAIDNFVLVLAGATNPPDVIPTPAPSEQPFFCGFNSSCKPKFAELNAINALVLLSQRLEILVSVIASPSSTVSQLKFGSCQIVDSYDRVHLEPLYPFDGMLPPQSVSDEDRRENGQVAVNFVSGEKVVEIAFTQLLVHYGHCNWIACIIRFFTDSEPADEEGSDRDQEQSECVMMTLKLKLCALQPALLPSPFISPRRLFVEEAFVSLIPGADDIFKTISIESKGLHALVAPHVNYVITCCNRVITDARNAHLDAVDRRNAPRHGIAGNTSADFARILRTDCTFDWQRMLPLDFSAACGFLCVATVPSLNLVKKSSPAGLIFELHDIELCVFACADSLARILATAASEDGDVVIIENPRAGRVDESVTFDASDEVVLSPQARLRLVEEEYRTSTVPALTTDGTSYGYLSEMYGKVRTSLVDHWSHLTGPGQVVDTNREVSKVEELEQVDEPAVSFDESCIDISSSSMLNFPAADGPGSAPIVQQDAAREENSHERDASFDIFLESHLSWRLELVNARVRFRVFAGCDFPEYVTIEETTTPPSCAPFSSLRIRDMDRSLELQVEGMHMRFSSYSPAAPISSRLSFLAQDIKIADNVTDSFFRCLIQKDESYLSSCGAYERDAPTVSLTVETLQKSISGSEDSEMVQRRLEAHILPLFCSLDERTLNAIMDVMHVYSTVAAENECSNPGNDWDGGEDCFLYQKFIISALTFRLNYKPIRYPIMLRDSVVSLHSVKLYQVLSGDVPDKILAQWGGLQEIFRQFLGGVANSVPVVSNVAHICAALNILIQQSIRNRSSARQVRRNVFAFLSALSGEIIDVALIATRVTDRLLSSASSVVVGDSRSRGREDQALLRSLNEDLKKIQQPANVHEGLQEAIKSFSQGLQCMLTIPSSQSRSGYIRRGAAALLMPAQGVTRGIFAVLSGLLNQIQPQRRSRRDEKYKDF